MAGHGGLTGSAGAGGAGGGGLGWQAGFVNGNGPANRMVITADGTIFVDGLRLYDVMGRFLGTYPFPQPIGATGWVTTKFDIDSTGGLGYTDATGLLFPGEGGRNPGDDASDCVVGRIAHDTSKLWTHQFGTDRTVPDRGSCRTDAIAVDSLGDIVVLGRLSAGTIAGQVAGADNSGTSSEFTARFDASGQLQWVRELTTASLDLTPSAIAADGVGEFFVTGGYSDANLDGGHFVAKYSADGANAWFMKYPGNLAPPSNIRVTNDGASIFLSGLGRKFGEITGQSGAMVAKLDGSGNLLWSTVTTPKRDPLTCADVNDCFGSVASGTDIVIEPDGSAVYMNGDAQGAGGEGHGGVYVDDGVTTFRDTEDMFVIKFDALGAVKWVKQFIEPPRMPNQNPIMGAADIALDPNGDVVLLGDRRLDDTNGFFFFLARLDPATGALK